MVKFKAPSQMVEDGVVWADKLPFNIQEVKKIVFLKDFLGFVNYLKETPIKLTVTKNISLKDIEGLTKVFQNTIKMKYGPDDNWDVRSEDQLPYLKRIDILASIMHITFNRKGRKRISRNGLGFLKLSSDWQYLNLFLHYWNQFNWSYFHPWSDDDEKHNLEILQHNRYNLRYVLLADYQNWQTPKKLTQQLSQVFGFNYQGVEDNFIADSIVWQIKHWLKELSLFNLVDKRSVKDKWGFEELKQFKLPKLGIKVLSL